MNTTIITQEEKSRKLHRIQDIFRELDQESRELLLQFLVHKYEVKI